MSDLECGIYHDVSWNDYVRLPYMNASTLCDAFLSAQHLRSGIEGKKKSADSPDRLFGRALHARLLEPKTYEERYVVAGGCCAELQTGANKGKPCGLGGSAIVGNEWRCGKHIPKGVALPRTGSLVSIDEDGRVTIHPREVVPREMKVRVDEAARAVERDKAVRLLKIAGGFEVTVVWDYEGVRCKSRLDKFCLETEDTPLLIIDLKKVQRGKGSDRHCRKAAAEYLYDVKAQFYRHAIHHATGLWSEFAWVFVEDTDPYGVNLFEMTSSDKRKAERRLSDCWSTYFSSMSSGEWPGYMNGNTTPKKGILPDWVD